MGKVRISFFKELYYWMYFYYSAFILSMAKMIKKYPPINVELASCLFLSVLRVFNFTCFWIIMKIINRLYGYEYDKKSNILFLIMILITVLDLFLFYKKRNQIIAICEQFSKKRRIIGQIKFWVYVVLTILFLYYVDGLRNSMG